MSLNHYDVLGVSREANADEIKRAYRALSLKWHPDRCTPDKKDEAQSKFQEIGAAYETLSDDRRRQEYNAELDGFRMGEGGQEVDISEVFNMMFGGGGGGMHFGMPGMHFAGGGGPQIHVFHGHGGGFSPDHIFRQLHKPPPIMKQIDLPFEQAYSGCTLCINVDKWTVKNDIKIHEIEPVYINIPPGIDNGEMIIMRDCGNTLSPDLKGDIKFIVKVVPSEMFERQGMDLLLKRTITLKESLTGFSFEITHVNGKLLCLDNLKNRTIIAPNYRKTIPNLGMMRDGNVGNLIIEFSISFPEKLTEEQIAVLSDVL
jgi:DnaJ-class molecular chaperone